MTINVCNRSTLNDLIAWRHPSGVSAADVDFLIGSADFARPLLGEVWHTGPQAAVVRIVYKADKKEFAMRLGSNKSSVDLVLRVEHENTSLLIVLPLLTNYS